MDLEGKKIEVKEICTNCKKEITWYKVFRQFMGDSIYKCNIIPAGDNISNAKISILENRDNEVDIDVSYRCRLCDFRHRLQTTIVENNGKLLIK